MTHLQNKFLLRDSHAFVQFEVLLDRIDLQQTQRAGKRSRESRVAMTTVTLEGNFKVSYEISKNVATLAILNCKIKQGYR